MLCRALLAAVAFSYLICVLFLSGIQRDDLDVGLLKKLEHYNVDLNDKSHRQRCLNKNDSDSKVTENDSIATKSPTNSKTETPISAEIEQEIHLNIAPDPKKENDTEKSNKLTNILERFKILLNSNKRFKNTTKSYAENDTDYLDRHDKPFINYTNIHKQDSSNQTEPIDDILHLSALAETTSNVSTSFTTEDSRRLFKNHEIEDKLFSSVAAINTLTENLISLQNNLRKQKALQLRMSPEPKHKLNKDDILHLYKIIENFKIDDNKQKSIERTEHTTATILNNIKTEEPDKDDILRLYKIIENFKVDDSKQIERTEHTTVTILNNTNVTKLNNTNSKQPVSKPQNDNLLTEIVESVKDIVLKDLRKDMASKENIKISSTPLTTSSTPASTTTDGATHQCKNVNKEQVSTQAIEKIVVLFEKLQNVPQKLMKPDKEKKEDQKVNPRINIQAPIVMFPHPPLAAGNPYGINVNQNPSPYINQMPFQNSYVLQKNIDGPMSNHAAQRIEMTSHTDPLRQPQEITPDHYPIRPIMIQSDLEDIKPLSIPIGKLPLMNLNIIVTTQNPPWTKEEKEEYSYMLKYRRNPAKKADINNVKETLSTYSNDGIATDHKTPINKNIFPTPQTETISTVKEYQSYNNNKNLNVNQTSRVNNGTINNNENIENYNNWNKNTNRKPINNLNINSNMNFNPQNNKIKTEQNPYVVNFEELSPLINTPTAYVRNEYQHSEKHPSKIEFQFGNNPKTKSNEYNKKEVVTRYDPYDPELSPFLSEALEDQNYYRNIAEKVNLNAKKDINPLDNIYEFDNTETKNDRPNRFNLLSLGQNAGSDWERNQNAEYVKHVFKNEYKNIASIDYIPNVRAKYENTDDHYSGPSAEEFNNENNKNRWRPKWYQETSRRRPSYSAKYRDYSNSRDNSRPWYGKTFNKATQDSMLSALHDQEKGRMRYDKESGRFNRGHRPYSLERFGLLSKSSNSRGRYFMVDKESRDSDGKRTIGMDVRGFHQRLEGTDPATDSLSDCGPDEHCLLQVLARQQTPIVGSKKSKYNDNHFKRFLKTQQKVNRMLERILATKPDNGAVDVL